MKFLLMILNLLILESHPSRGAWIEIAGDLEVGKVVRRRTPRGVRGLKLVVRFDAFPFPRGRTPRGVRGLKWHR